VNDKSVKVLDKAIDLIEIISRDPRGLKLSEITNKSGLNKTTAYRILSTMLDRKFLEKDENGYYRIGSKMLEVISYYISKLELQTESRPYLWQLTNKLQLSAILAVFYKNESILVDKMEFIHDHANFNDFGIRLPVYSTAYGKCLMATMSSVELDYLFEEIELVKLTDYTLTSKEQILKELKQIKKLGYAMDNEEHEYNERCIAAPIYDYRGEAIAAITVSGTNAQFSPEKLPEIIKEVKKAAKKISERMGYYS